MYFTEKIQKITRRIFSHGRTVMSSTRLIYSYSFKIGIGLAVQYQLGILQRKIVNLIAKFCPLVHIADSLILTEISQFVMTAFL